MTRSINGMGDNHTAAEDTTHCPRRNDVIMMSI